jgi:putative addiction module component (TIGR02574 family)
MNPDLVEQARALSPGDQLDLVERLWNEIARIDSIPLPTEAQRAELERRLADCDAHPEDVLPRESVKSSAFAALKRRRPR